MTHKKTEIILNNETAYLAGAIIGDGYLANKTKSKKDLSKDYQIKIDLSDKKYLILLFRILKKLTNTKSTPKVPKMRGNRKERLYILVRNKALFEFLTIKLGIPSGAKSSKVFMPDLIKKSSTAIKKHFLAGYFDTDGGFRNKTLGFTTASVRLNDDISDLLDELKICHIKESWMNKRYDKRFYGIQIRRNEIDIFLNTCPFRNKQKLKNIKTRFKNMRGCRSGQTG